MNVDSKFNKRSATQVSCNYTDVTNKPFNEQGRTVEIRFFGGQDDGDLRARMNVLEAHRLVGQLNDCLAAHAKASIAKAVKP